MYQWLLLFTGYATMLIKVAISLLSQGDLVAQESVTRGYNELKAYAQMIMQWSTHSQFSL